MNQRQRVNDFPGASQPAIPFLLRRTEVRIGQNPASQYGFPLRGLEELDWDAGSVRWTVLDLPPQRLAIQWVPQAPWTKVVRMSPSEAWPG
jgi:hypothetical protein